MNSTSTSRWNLFCQARSVNLADVIVHSDQPGQISGQIRGPYCKYARTLPSTFRIEQGRAPIVDPCFWTTAMPFQYEVQLRVECSDGSTVDEQFLWGLRWCIPHKQDLRLNGKRYVVRAIRPTQSELDLVRLREVSASVLVDSPTAELCAEASEVGVMLLDTSPQTAVDSSGLNRFPAVHFFSGAAQSHTDLLSFSDSTGSHIRLLDETEVVDAPTPTRPAFVRRTVAAGNYSELRRGCDWLQRDIAAAGQFAGYLIYSEA